MHAHRAYSNLQCIRGVVVVVIKTLSSVIGRLESISSSHSKLIADFLWNNFLTGLHLSSCFLLKILVQTIKISKLVYCYLFIRKFMTLTLSHITIKLASNPKKWGWPKHSNLLKLLGNSVKRFPKEQCRFV